VSVDFKYPKLRPVEARPAQNQQGAIDIFDRSGISQSVITLSGPAIFIVSRMDGTHSRADIQAAFTLRHGRMLFSSELDTLIEQLDESMLLCGNRFDRHLDELTSAYRAAKFRPLRDVESLGAPRHKINEFLDEILRQTPQSTQDQSAHDTARLAGFIAPHLDYSRGAPCYAAAYQKVLRHADARRFVILGTNHFGRATSVVGTSKAFETPGGIVPCDESFMQRINKRCGVDLFEHEYDHAREHSIELQAVLLRHVLPDREFSIACYLCPDPCGPTGTAPPEGRGVDLKDFAIALREEIACDPVPTCIIASADLSHVGRYFQDDNDLSKAFLQSVAQSDQQALTFVSASDPEGFRTCVASTGNRTNICSVGCIFTLATALRGFTEPQMLHYHQALTSELENCVTSTAFAYYSGGPTGPK
jgi:AmmeMemoRadiSam system protein B